MQARERSFAKIELDDFIDHIIEQYNNEKDLYWLRQKFEYFVEGYRNRSNP
jgi:hypothetical protein